MAYKSFDNINQHELQKPLKRRLIYLKIAIWATLMPIWRVSHFTQICQHQHQQQIHPNLPQQQFRQLCTKWSHWYLFENKTYTVHGNMRSPGYTTVIQWLSDICHQRQLMPQWKNHRKVRKSRRENLAIESLIISKPKQNSTRERK
jgi:hypothetical protein